MEIFRFPLTKVTVCFVAGIAAAQFVSCPWIYMACICMALLPVVLFFRKSKASASLLLMVMAGLLGFCLFMAGKWSSDPGHYLRKSSGRHQVLQVELRERLKPTKRQRYIAWVKHVDGKKTEGKLLLQLPIGARYPIGAQLLVSGKIVRNQPPQNPAQFDYGHYLDAHNIPAQCFVAPGNTLKIGVSRNFFHYADALCNSILGTLKQSGFNAQSLAVLGALVLGQRQDIDAQTVSDYQLAGAVHILSVSGLHVGFIALFLNVLLKPLPKSRFWRRFSLAAILISLWIFAGISGLSPSVVRAATMFSFVAIGRHLRRETESLHAVTVSALVILIVAPDFMFDVGFQLSYAAVISILLFEPHFRNFVRVKNPVLKYFRDIVTVSLAAQLGTLPFSLFYFHQFPGLFLATNLIVIPMLSLIMALGVLAMVVAAFGFTLVPINLALEKSLELMDAAIGKIAAYDGFVIRDISTDGMMLFLGSAIVLALWVFMKKPTFRNCALVAMPIIVLQAYVLYFHWKESQSETILVFEQPRASLVVIRNGRQMCAFSDSGKWEKMTASTYAVSHGLSCRQMPISPMLFANGRKILLWSGNNLPTEDLHADILVLRQSPKVNFERLLKIVKPKTVVADGSNYRITAAIWKRICLKQKIPFHDTREKGCFVLGD